MWESSAGRDPHACAARTVGFFGDELMADWRARTKGSSVRLRAYVDVHPSADSRLTLDAANRNRHGDPMPKIEHHVKKTTRRKPTAATKAHVLGVFQHARQGEMAKVINGLTYVRYYDVDSGARFAALRQPVTRSEC